MDSPLSSHFFLGANSPGGFTSLYGDFTDSSSETLYILKGGPGCGKSTMMKAIGRAARNAGLDVEYIHCSGDPDSLDGVRIPQKSAAYVDGTSPHVIEPVYAGSQGVYVNLGAFYDREALSAARGDIARLTRAYKAQYARAFKLLSGAAALCDTPSLPEEAIIAAKKRAHSIIRRELHDVPANNGVTVRRFLSAYTCKGQMTLWDTVSELCPRVWVLDNDLGLGGIVVDAVAAECARRGCGAIECRSPMFPERTEHLLVPEAGFALVTQTSRSPCPLPRHRHLRLDAIPDRGSLPALKALVRESARLRAPLIDRALDALRQAKALHDELEALYIPNVDFSGVDRLTARHIRALLD